ncbi:MAG: DUF1615 domain-containing protein [Rhodanobacteraceae bacterium]
MLAACATQPKSPPGRSAQRVQSQIVLLLPDSVDDPNGWARDIQIAFDRLGLTADKPHLCAALAVIAQESTFEAHPVVPGLARIARGEIKRRAAQHHIPGFMVETALKLKSPNGQSYDQRLDAVHTESELSRIFEDLVGSVPLGRRLFGDANPVQTGGPMQVSIDYAEHAAALDRYPYPVDGSVRREVFSRRGGLYFGIANLLDYPVSYSYMRYRFADYNAGHYASRNAAFQHAVALLSGRNLALDGDLLAPGGQAGATERVVRSLAPRLGLDASAIHDALSRGTTMAFEDTALYRKVYAMADAKAGSRQPRAMLPHIRLHSPKISRKLTTAWFARRVDARYRACLRK